MDVKPEKTKIVEFKVNKKPVKIEKGKHKGLVIKQAAIDQGVKIQLDFVLSLQKGGQQKTRVIGNNEEVQVKEDTCFVAIANDDDS